MGYTTYFDGKITIDPPLNPDEIKYLTEFAESRRMNRERGPYFIGGTGLSGQGHDPDVRDYNRPPEGQPGLWCKWMPTEDGTALEWSGAEKFYDAEEWMRYLIDHFLKPGGLAQGDENIPEAFTFDHTCNGIIDAAGEDPDDRWRLVVEDNNVRSQMARIVCED